MSIRHWLRGLLSRRVVEREIADELAFHIALETEQNVARGMPADEAKRAALVAFNGLEQHAEACREARRTRAMEDFVRDIRQGLRGLRRSPGYATVSVLTLALGIGASTAAFSVIEGVLLRPLPYAEPERLFSVMERDPKVDLPRLASYPTFEDWRARNRAFEDMAFVHGDQLTVRGPEGPMLLGTAYVSDGFFPLLGARPVLGRTFDGGESGGDRPAMISHALWQQAFGGDPSILGRSLDTPDGALTVVGVADRGFGYPAWADVWAPISTLPPTGRRGLTQRDLHVDSRVVARLRTGVTVEHAIADMEAVAGALAAEYPIESADFTSVRLTSVREETVGDVGSRLAILSGAVLLLLLVSCVNVANLTVARASSRAREMALRTALGAGRGRLVRQLLTEGALLALAGGAMGVLLAGVGVSVMRGIAEDALPRLAEVEVNGRVLGFALGVSLLASLLFGLAPALHGTGRRLVTPLRAGNSGSGVSAGTARLRAGLVVLEIALAVVLVVGAGLLVNSFRRIQDVEAGFDPQGLALVRVMPPDARYDNPARALELYRNLRAAAASVPGVQSAALANHVPYHGASMPTPVSVPGRDAGERDLALYRGVSPEYFETLRTTIRRGRPLTQADLAPGGGVVVNDAFVSRFMDGRQPIGEVITFTHSAQGRPRFGEPITAPIVGIAGDEKFFGPEMADAIPAIYVPYTWSAWGNTFVIARGENPERLIPALRKAILAVDPQLPIAGPGFDTQLRTMDEFASARIAQRRTSTVLLGAFAGASFLLALVGVAGVMAYVVAQRTAEIGLRLALGATSRGIMLLVVRRTLLLVAAGLTLGLLGAAFALRLLQTQLFGVSATDPATYALVASLFGASALISGMLPARRATRVDPMVALRAE